MSNTRFSIPTLATVIGGLAISAAAFVPGIASASATDTLGCVGKTIKATSDYQVLYGTSCNDIISIGGYVSVTVHAGAGDDTVYAGYGESRPFIHLGAGNDRLVNARDRVVSVYGDAGNDVLQGSSHEDALHGGSGYDTANPRPGDVYTSIAAYY